MVDWESIAKANGMSDKEFEIEILTCAACLGAIRLDNGDAGDADTLKFTCSDQIGKIAVYVRRLDAINDISKGDL